ncbi:MAG: hypothetical protein A2010_16755 [Nitrospirae bacterium GWD2_57_9]|nr:MAG: hypothetical protein A2010_16755 [Nitrospirae bacterium GWD2_57_9]OGW51148.1 MAG: hypothetical protein A2078_13505 [Nitrospirae bacterium GWC2_57_9]
MPEVVKVSTVESSQKLTAAIEEYFKKGRYAEITQAIGMHSVLIDPQHTMEDQSRLYRSVLALLKKRIAEKLGKDYAGWYTDFPKIMDGMVAGGQVVTDKGSLDILSSHRAAQGPFKSVDDFFLWALDDRRLTLEQIVKYIETSAAIPRK